MRFFPNYKRSAVVLVDSYIIVFRRSNVTERRHRRQFTEEFKRNALRQYFASDVTTELIFEELNINRASLKHRM